MSGSKVIFDDTKNPELTSNLDHIHMDVVLPNMEVVSTKITK